MPEVCEVALSAAFLADKLINFQIISMSILGGRYSKTPLDNIDKFKEKMPLTITNVGSKGKQMWFKLKDADDKPVYILSHFGMEGKWGFSKEKHSHIKFELKNKIDNKKNKQVLYFSDQRNFGRIEFLFKHSLFRSVINDIGPDFFER